MMWGGGGCGFVVVVVWGFIFFFTWIKSKSRPSMNANAGDCCMNFKNVKLGNTVPYCSIPHL